jgi:transposase
VQRSWKPHQGGYTQRPARAQALQLTRITYKCALALALLGISSRQVGDWLRIFRNQGLDHLCTLHYRGDPGRLRPAQIEHLKQEIAKGVFHNAEQVRAWIEEQCGIIYSTSGVKDLLHRIGASYHKVSGFFLEGGPEETASVRAQVSAASA